MIKISYHILNVDVIYFDIDAGNILVFYHVYSALLCLLAKCRLTTLYTGNIETILHQYCWPILVEY